MKRVRGVILVLFAVGALCLWLKPEALSRLGLRVFPGLASSAGPPGNSNQPPGSVSAPGVAAASPPKPPATLADQAGLVEPETSAPAPDVSPEIILQNVRRSITQYGAMFGGNPVGTNPEITAALAGHNPKQVNFINPEAGMRVDEKGELVDAWGTPLFFHQLSGSETEVRSAGPDRRMWTPDDLVAR